MINHEHLPAVIDKRSLVRTGIWGVGWVGVRVSMVIDKRALVRTGFWRFARVDGGCGT